MKGKKIAKIFESIPKFETYSHYNSTLEKIFKSNSLKNLIETLKRQKEIAEISLIDQISKVNTNEPIDIYAEENSDLKKINNEEEIDIFDEIEEENSHNMNIPIKNAEKKRHELWHNTISEIKKKKFKLALDPFKYNPNYNSIYKNVPSFRIIDPKKSLIKLDAQRKSRKKSRNQEKIKSKNSGKPLKTEINNINIINKTPLKKNNALNTISNINENSKKDVKLPKIKLSKNKIKITDSLYSENENHAMRFSKYIPRKYIIPDHNKNVSYLDPINYIKPKNKNKSIDFDKMLHRSEKNLIYASTLKNPSFDQYNPKYTYIDKNQTARLFNPEEKLSSNNKKFLMRKLWASYKVNIDYQLVDNNKINSN